MADTLTDQFTYTDNGKLILKKSWWDPETGDTYDTFDEVGDAPLDAPQGSVYGQGTLNQSGQPTGQIPTGADVSRNQPDAGTIYQPQLNTATGRTTGSSVPQSNTYAAPAAPGAPQQPAASPGGQTQPFNTSPAANAPSSAEGARQGVLYDYTNPGFALQNALRTQGYNPFVNSPFMSYINRMAPGLQQAFLLNQAGQPGLTPADAARGPDRFQQFLTQAIQGGNIPGVVAGASQALPGALSAIRDYQTRLGAGESMANANPYLNELSTTLGSGYGQGTTNFLAATLGPFMGRNLLSAYQSNLQNSLMNAIRGWVEAPEFGTPEGQQPGYDVWRYLLGQ